MDDKQLLTPYTHSQSVILWDSISYVLDGVVINRLAAAAVFNEDENEAMDYLFILRALSL